MPDAGTSCFWYDYLGRLILSQNAKQLDNSQMSYTLFDKLGRTVEVGESYWAWDGISPVPFTAFTTYSNIEQYYNAVDNHAKTLKKPQDFIYQYNNFGLEERWDVTRTFYDKTPNAAPVIPNFTPENLRNRVAVTASYSYTYHDYADATNDGYDNGYPQIATSYNYDVAGNVKTMVHDIPELQSFQYQNTGQSRNHRFKRLDYDYDLVSGKVNQLFYQRDEPDQFVYGYKYDADNRLTKAESSTDGKNWLTEATYKYYKHGPLSRIELGRENNKIQGMDYAYTLQGWIKGVNSSFLDPNKDIGRDGTGTSRVRKDAFGYTIGYFDGDYKPIGGEAVRFDVRTDDSQPLAATSAYVKKGLFNGNIRYIASDNQKFDKPLLMTYNYDQLNRINKMESWQNQVNKTTSFTWTRSSPGTEWGEEIKYDPNGNIKTYKRNDDKGRQIDNLSYKYIRDALGNLITNNRLNAVHDYVSETTPYPDDIEGTEAENAFTYDKIGNLTFDKKLNTRFDWTVYGKMGSAAKKTYTNVLMQETGSEFGYDAQQNRYKKDNFVKEENALTRITTEKHDVNYYIRDAQGNVLAIYSKQHNRTINTETGSLSQQSYQLKQKEQHLYGSSRLGIVQLERPMASMAFHASDLVTQNQGTRNYELTNHLGNVLSTITDKGVITSAQDYFPFGLTLASRSFTEGGSVYRFGFNGKENDKELKQQDYKNRINRPDLGRFLSVDPLTKQFAFLTPYQFASNTPISAIDLDGLEAVVVIGGVTVSTAYYKPRKESFFMYEVKIYNNMTFEDYKLAYNAGTLRVPDATTKLARDSWHSASDRSELRYGSMNETPPGLYYLTYHPDGIGSKGHLIKVSDGIVSDEINGSDGKREGVRIHQYNPCFTLGCFSTDARGKKDALDKTKESVHDFVDLIPDLKDGEGKEASKPVRLVVEERPAAYNVEKKRWEGTENKAQNIQRLGNITFDSNLIRLGGKGNLIATDLSTGKPYGVNRNDDGSYRFDSGQK